MSPRAVAVGTLLALACGAGCQSLSDYRGTFEGAIIKGNFVRRCFPPETRASLVFDAEKAVAVTEIPDEFNLLTTTDGTFDETPLVPLTALPHDQLSALDFPGPKRVRNFILTARPDSGPLEGRDVTVVVSVLEKGSVELRVMGRTDDDAPACEPVADDERSSSNYVVDPHEYYGVFQLSD